MHSLYTGDTMNFITTIYTAILFFILSPGIIVTLPFKSKKPVSAGLHAIIFALVLHFTLPFVPVLYEGLDNPIGQTTYKPDPNSLTVPNGPPYATTCNNSTLTQSNAKGEICQKKGDNFVWVIPCNLRNVGIKNVEGKIFKSQRIGNSDNAVYNWV